MSDVFLDTSALAKRNVPEAGTQWIRSLTAPSAGNTSFVAQIFAVEMTSVAMRRQREGSISARTARAIRLLVERHISQEYLVIRLSDQIVRRAQDLLATHPLRAYDSVQLASALEVNLRLLAHGQQPLTFIAADHRLLAVAAAEGLATDNPDVHP